MSHEDDLRRAAENKANAIGFVKMVTPGGVMYVRHSSVTAVRAIGPAKVEVWILGHDVPYESDHAAHVFLDDLRRARDSARER